MVTLPTSHSLTLTLHGRISSSAAAHVMCNVPWPYAIKCASLVSVYVHQVRCARQQLQKPAVVEGELEPDSSLWCYFCELEVMRHVTDRLTTVVWGGLLEHMAR